MSGNCQLTSEHMRAGTNDPMCPVEHRSLRSTRMWPEKGHDWLKRKRRVNIINRSSVCVWLILVGWIDCTLDLRPIYVSHTYMYIHTLGYYVVTTCLIIISKEEIEQEQRRDNDSTHSSNRRLGALWADSDTTHGYTHMRWTVKTNNSYTHIHSNPDKKFVENEYIPGLSERAVVDLRGAVSFSSLFHAASYTTDLLNKF